MKAKSGKSIQAVNPAEPEEALEADVADPGVVEKIKLEQIESQTGKYGTQRVEPFHPRESEEGEEEPTSWIELEVVDEADQPVPGLAFRITLPDGTVDEGTLDGDGFYRLEGIPEGECEICFTELDESAIEQIG